MAERKMSCHHRWEYYKVAKNSPDNYVDCVLRICPRCLSSEFVRKLKDGEMNNVGMVKV